MVTTHISYLAKISLSQKYRRSPFHEYHSYIILSKNLKKMEIISKQILTQLFSGQKVLITHLLQGGLLIIPILDW